MKRFLSVFLLRGMVAAGFGPIVLAILYLLLQAIDEVNVLSVDQVCIGIFSITALSFIAGGMNAIYKIEKLPLMIAISIHGGVLYICYLFTYLINDWLNKGLIPILSFTAIFIVGYIAIWIITYSVIRKKTGKLNKLLNKTQEND